MPASKGVDSLQPGTPQWELRARCRKHNGLHGTLAQAIKMFEAIATSPTVTPQTTEICSDIIERCQGELKQALLTRVD